MKFYKVNCSTLPGSGFKEVHRHALIFYNRIKARTKRRPYVRCAYFRKSKIFLGIFWTHLFEKNWRDRTRRLKFFSAAIYLIRNSRFDPVSNENPNRKSEILHKFYGKTSDNKRFCVQIKENKRNSQKFFISVFPDE